MPHLKFLASLLILCMTVVAMAQSEAEHVGDWWKQIEVKPTAALQVWTSYTMGQQLYNESTGSYEQVGNRLNTQLRRSRFGLKGKAGVDLKFNLTLAADLIGRDLLSGTEGGANNGGSPKPRLWNAYLLWRLIPGQEWLFVSAGYQVPQIGRESTASALRSSSMEKTWSQNYLRRHLVGTGPGRAMGIQFGGLLLPKSGSPWSSRYDIGLYNPPNTAFGGNSAGRQTAPLTTARYRLSYGDPEANTYSLGTPVQFFGERQGASLALSGAWQGQNDIVRNSVTIGADVLVNLGPWTLDGSWLQLGRQRLTLTDSQGADWSYARTGHLRLSHLSKVNNHYLEAVLTYTFLQGALSAEEQELAQAVQHFAGEDQYVEVAINWYFSEKLKLTGSYTARNGNAGSQGAGAAFNNYLYQAGLGAIRRGDWLGAGIVAIF